MERSAAQEHFIDLCRLLDEPTPAEAYSWPAGISDDDALDVLLTLNLRESV